ncbi:hypothetical protein TWF718_006497 [Orbilia javanica]|uniref:Uncharacterized protein n=1 Tax=Orbilia javanica TaxID=47235 RepID=A0AAN8N3A3_9PEZI
MRGHYFCRVGAFILSISGLAKAQHGSVSYDRVVEYTLTNTQKLEEVGQLLKALYVEGRDRYRVGVLDETLIRDNDIRTWEEQTSTIEENASDYDIVQDPTYTMMSRHLSEFLTTLHQRLKAGEFDWRPEDSDSDEEAKGHLPGEPYVRRPGPPHFDLIGSMHYHIDKVPRLKKLNEEILTTKVIVPADFYKKDLDDRPQVPGNTQNISFLDMLLLLIWDPRDKGDGTPLELVTWIYAIEEGAGELSVYDVAGRYNLYLAVQSLRRVLEGASLRLEDLTKEFFQNVYTKDHYEFAPIWDLTQNMIRFLQFYGETLSVLENLLESLPSLIPAPVRQQN